MSSSYKPAQLIKQLVNGWTQLELHDLCTIHRSLIINLTILFKFGDLGESQRLFHVVIWTSDPFCAFRPIERRPMQNELKIRLFVLLLLLLFVVACFFESMSRFYQ